MFSVADEVPYKFLQAVIESKDFGSHSFVPEGILRRIHARDKHNIPRVLINDQINFQGCKDDRSSN